MGGDEFDEIVERGPCQSQLGTATAHIIRFFGNERALQDREPVTREKTALVVSGRAARATAGFFSAPLWLRRSTPYHDETAPTRPRLISKPIH